MRQCNVPSVDKKWHVLKDALSEMLLHCEACNKRAGWCKESESILNNLFEERRMIYVWLGER